MEWLQKDVFQLIEGYKDKRLLWDPADDDFKNRTKRHDAWSELDNQFGVEAGESERKIRKLVGQFNRESKKVLMSGKGESGKWCYFKPLLFLKRKNKPKTSVDVGMVLNYEDDAVCGATVETQMDETNEVEDDDGAVFITGNSSHESSYAGTPPSWASAPKKKTLTMAEEVFNVMKGILDKRKVNDQDKQDEFDTYGKHVTMSLRKLSKISAAHAKFEISKILFNAEMGHYEPTTRNLTSIIPHSSTNISTNSSNSMKADDLP